MNVFYSKSSLKHLSKLEKDIKAKIVEAIETLPHTGDIKKMRGRTLKDLYRLRVGKYRILFLWTKNVIKILDVDTRGDIYK
jgi:mRNA-degrading endonuclease RelE of RelBE toxin-antitoxin system